MSPFPEIFLVRHGETTWNRIGRHQGHLDAPLTRKGAEQAVAVGRLLAATVEDWNATRLQCSPLFRCRQTAALLCDAAGVDVERVTYDDRLKERCYGRWQGLTDEEIKARYADEWQTRALERWDHAIEGGGESRRQLTDRMAGWLADQDPGTPLLVVSHGEAGKAMRGVLRGLNPEEVLALGEPQGAVMHLKDGAETILEAALGAVSPDSP